MQTKTGIKLRRLGTAARGRAMGVLFGVMWAAAASPGASAQTIAGLGFLPGGSSSTVYGGSADGSTVVGLASTPSGERAFRWTRATGMQSLGVLPGRTSSVAYAASADGSVIVGSSGSSGEYPHAFRWTSGAGMQELALFAGATGAEVRAVSADGSVAIGIARFGGGFHAFRWTSSEGTQDLGVVPGTFSSWATGVSADGAAITGSSMGASIILPFRWTSAQGFQLLGGLLAIESPSAISADGATIVGEASDPLMHIRDHAFLWTMAGGLHLLPELPGTLGSHASAVNADGTTTVGRCEILGADLAVRWHANDGPVDLNTYLASIGIDLSGWTLTQANTISADGLTIAGNGTHENASEAWVATLAKCPADFNLDQLVNSQDCFDFIVAFFSADPAADFNSDGTVDSRDFFEFLTRFFTGCP